MLLVRFLHPAPPTGLPREVPPHSRSPDDMHPVPRCASLRLACALGLAFASVGLQAADWPQWGGAVRRNMVSAEKGLPSRFDPGKRKRNELGFDPETSKNVKWIARLGAEN